MRGGRGKFISVWLHDVLDDIMDIARCRCFINKPIEYFKDQNCTCINEDKILNFQTYLDQKFDKNAIILLSEKESSKSDLMMLLLPLLGWIPFEEITQFLLNYLWFH